MPNVEPETLWREQERLHDETAQPQPPQVNVVKYGIGALDHFVSHSLVKPTIPFWHAIGFTPNALTTLGAGASLASLWFYRHHSAGNAFGAILFLWIRMYFDYADGMLARTHKMSSKFGDFYDHFVDVMFMLGFVYLTITRYPKKFKVGVLVLLGVFVVMLCIHASCVQLQNDHIENSDTFDAIGFLSCMCGEKTESIFAIADNIALYIVMSGIVVFAACVKHGKQNKEE